MTLSTIIIVILRFLDTFRWNLPCPLYERWDNESQKLSRRHNVLGLENLGHALGELGSKFRKKGVDWRKSSARQDNRATRFRQLLHDGNRRHKRDMQIPRLRASVFKRYRVASRELRTQFEDFNGSG